MDSRVNLIVSSARPDALARAREVLVGDCDGNCVTHELPIIDSFSVAVDPRTLQRLPELGRLSDDLSVAPDLDVAVPDPPPEAGQPHAQLDVARGTLHVQELWDQGLRGKGVGIAIVDTGIAPHPDLRDRIVAFHDEVNGRASAYDDHGHGSHVSGIAAGSGSRSGGRYAGMAPEASLIGVKVLDEKGKGKSSDIVAGIQWAVDNKQRYNIRAMNISIGGKAWISEGFDPMSRAVDKAVEKGIFVAVAAGNSGPDPSTVESPGIALGAATVGNVMQWGTTDRGDDTIASSSGRGPTKYDGNAKPDVCAPGTWITSCDTGTGYVEMSGTSMATPMVAGAAALLLQARPDVYPSTLKTILMNTAAPLKDTPDTAQGKGMMDPPVALASLRALPSEFHAVGAGVTP